LPRCVRAGPCGPRRSERPHGPGRADPRRAAPLRKQLQQTEHLLAVLAGRPRGGCAGLHAGRLPLA
jgi:hypothetical protein